VIRACLRDPEGFPVAGAAQDRNDSNKKMAYIDSSPQRNDWDAYVLAAPRAAYSHLFGWGEALAATYDLPLLRLAAREEGSGRIGGLLPLIVFSPPGSDSRLISLPYTDGAGILADSQTAARLLLDEALALAHRLRVDHLELRQPGTFGAEVGAILAAQECYHPHSFKVGLCRGLPENSEKLWRELPAKVRNQVRKARKCGCSARFGTAELLDDFYQVFAENMRDLGSPVHARKLFANVLQQLPGRAHIVMVYLEGRPAAAAMALHCGKVLANPWAASVRSLRAMCPNMLLYWSMVELGCNLGCTTFDFGRSTPGASTCRFKLQWGAEMVPLTWQVVSLAGKAWNPLCESLEDEEWKTLALSESRRRGPGLRRWISL